jgi:hypothetical protein
LDPAAARPADDDRLAAGWQLDPTGVLRPLVYIGAGAIVNSPGVAQAAGATVAQQGGIVGSPGAAQAVGEGANAQVAPSSSKVSGRSRVAWAVGVLAIAGIGVLVALAILGTIEWKVVLGAMAVLSAVLGAAALMRR